ncbi:MAG TPA: UDP-glucose 4-epimerase GalE [Bacteroidales bacterium]|jgi:UDP-glucose 4-epimerase|nr:UDP-glucose 4-epimerase GalE [Bacteroidales bacterium]HPT52983.1 UDP-glucose 4-epimerase GalE [Bacteroidales bacterium]
MKRILVTGGNGYIGSHTLIELIKSREFEVISVDNYSRSAPGTMDRIEAVCGVSVVNYDVDLCDKAALFHFLDHQKQIDGIIHFAAYKSVPESVDKPLSYYRNNLNSLANVLEACDQYHIPHFIFSSSCSIYGEVEQLPVSEETPIGEAFCPYAHTKQIGEKMIRSFAHIHPELQFVLLRYFNPVGADMSGKNGELSSDQPNNLFPILMETGIGKRQQMTVYGTDYETRDGSCIRDYIHVSDIADAHVKALQFLINHKNDVNCEVFNLGSGNGVSVLEMIHAFEKITNRKLNYVFGERRQGDIPAIYSNSQKANLLLGWNCRYNVEDMILSAWKWQQELS